MSSSLDRLPVDLLKEIFEMIAFPELVNLVECLSKRLLAALKFPGIVKFLPIDSDLGRKDSFAKIWLLKNLSGVEGVFFGSHYLMHMNTASTKLLQWTAAMNPKTVRLSHIPSSHHLLPSQLTEKESKVNFSALFPHATSLFLPMETFVFSDIILEHLPKTLTHLAWPQFNYGKRQLSDANWKALPPTLISISLGSIFTLDMVLAEQYLPNLERVRGTFMVNPMPPPEVNATSSSSSSTSNTPIPSFYIPQSVTALSAVLMTRSRDRFDLTVRLPAHLKVLQLSITGRMAEEFILSIARALAPGLEKLKLLQGSVGPALWPLLPPTIKTLHVSRDGIKQTEFSTIITALPNLETLSQVEGESPVFTFTQAIDPSKKIPIRLKHLHLSNRPSKGDFSVLPTSLEVLCAAFPSFESLILFRSTHPSTIVHCLNHLPYPITKNSTTPNKASINTMQCHAEWKRRFGPNPLKIATVELISDNTLTELIFESLPTHTSTSAPSHDVYRTPALSELPCRLLPQMPPLATFNKLEKLTMYLRRSWSMADMARVSGEQCKSLKYLDLGTTPLELPFRMSLLPKALTGFRSQCFAGKSDVRWSNKHNLEILDVPNFCVSVKSFLTKFGAHPFKELAFCVHEKDLDKQDPIEELLTRTKLPEFLQINSVPKPVRTRSAKKQSVDDVEGAIYDLSPPPVTPTWNENDPIFDAPKFLDLVPLSHPDQRPLPRWQCPYPTLAYYIFDVENPSVLASDNSSFNFANFASFTSLRHLNCNLSFTLPDNWISCLPPSLGKLQLPRASLASHDGGVEFLAPLPRQMTVLCLQSVQIRFTTTTIGHLPKGLTILLSRGLSEDKEGRKKARTQIPGLWKGVVFDADNEDDGEEIPGLLPPAEALRVAEEDEHDETVSVSKKARRMRMRMATREEVEARQEQEAKDKDKETRRNHPKKERKERKKKEERQMRKNKKESEEEVEDTEEEISEEEIELPELKKGKKAEKEEVEDEEAEEKELEKLESLHDEEATSSAPIPATQPKKEEEEEEVAKAVEEKEEEKEIEGSAADSNATTPNAPIPATKPAEEVVKAVEKEEVEESATEAKEKKEALLALLQSAP